MQRNDKQTMYLKYLSVLNTRILKLIYKGTAASAEVIPHINEFKNHIKHEFLQN